MLFINSETSEVIPFLAILSEKTITLQWERLTCFPIYALSKFMALFIDDAFIVSIIALLDSEEDSLEKEDVSINSNVTWRFFSPSFSSTAKAIT